MSKRILIVGGVAGGASVAARVRRLDESADITVFERGPHVSFSNCALPYFLSRKIEKSDNLILMNPTQFKKQYNIDTRVENEVISIDRANKKVKVKNHTDGTEYEESYDELILSPGGEAILPASIEGIGNENVFVVKNVVDIRKLDDYIQAHGAKNIAVIGGGFIGVEVAENLVEAGFKVSLVEAMDQIMAPYDKELVHVLHKEVMDHGVNLILSDGIKAIKEKNIVLVSGKEVEADVVVMAIGVKPETALAKAAGLEIGEQGGILVDSHYQTNDPHIYAVGDAIEVTDFFSGKQTRLPLAWPAQMQARAVANHLYRIPSVNRGFMASSTVRIFDMYAASTGMNEKTLKKEGIPYDYVYVIPQDKVGIMPESYPLFLKVLFDKTSGKILGAQSVGRHNPERRINIIATAIAFGGKVQDLAHIEFCYAPVMGTAKDAVNMAGLVGSNILNGVFKQVPVTKVRELVETNAMIIDVREVGEYEASHIKTAVNIPLSEIRDRLSEIPKDRPVYLHCRSSQRSYNAIMMLQNNGYENVYNISGSFLALSYNTYGEVTFEGKENILTGYNFN